MPGEARVKAKALLQALRDKSKEAPTKSDDEKELPADVEVMKHLIEALKSGDAAEALEGMKSIFRSMSSESSEPEPEPPEPAAD